MTPWERIRNEPARVGALIIVIVNALAARGVFELTAADIGWINVGMAILFGEGVRQLAYGPVTGKQLSSEVEMLSGELLDQ